MLTKIASRMKTAVRKRFGRKNDFIGHISPLALEERELRQLKDMPIFIAQDDDLYNSDGTRKDGDDDLAERPLAEPPMDPPVLEQVKLNQKTGATQKDGSGFRQGSQEKATPEQLRPQERRKGDRDRESTKHFQLGLSFIRKNLFLLT